MASIQKYGSPVSLSTRINGQIAPLKNIKKFLGGQNRMVLALDNWGQSPWRTSRVLAEAALMLERNSADSEKKQIAQCTCNQIQSRIAFMYTELARAISHGEPSIATKIQDDISFVETILGIMQSQVNWFVSFQKSLRADAAQLNARFNNELAIPGVWDRMKKHLPFLDYAVPLTAAAASWYAKIWAPFVKLAQYGVGLVCANPVLKGIFDKIANGGIYVAGFALITWGTACLDRLSLKRKEALHQKLRGEQAKILEKEQKERGRILMRIREEAVFLAAKYGYLLELLIEDAQYAALLKKGDYAGINRVHSQRV